MTIKLKRGLKSGLPLLQQGEPAFTTDTKEVFIGDGTSNVRLSASIIETTYAALKTLRDAGDLTPGQQYRITDFVTTTIQADTRSAGHPFDLIVVADSANKLNEQARAIQHAGDIYFANSKLEAWKVWYCLDNDTSRFVWAEPGNIYSYIELKSAGYKFYAPIGTIFAVGTVLYSDKACTVPSGKTVTGFDSTTGNPKIYNYGYMVLTPTEVFPYPSGKGIIYKMIDEWGNNVPYDFKNIQVYTKGYWRYTFGSIESVAFLRTGNPMGIVERNSSGDVTINDVVYHCYTLPLIMSGFSTTSVWITDEAFLKTSVYYDIIEGVANVVAISWGYYDLSFTTLYDNSVLFPSGPVNRCEENVIERFRESEGIKLSLNSFGVGCKRNVLGRNCSYNIIENSSCSNKFGNECYNNLLGRNCFHNTFGNYCNSNILDSYVEGNCFGPQCSANVLGYQSSFNTFGQECYSNVFDESCNNNTLGSSCNNNSFGITCSNNTLGSSCDNNSFGASCINNSFGSYCSSNTFVLLCQYNVLGIGCQYLMISEDTVTRKKCIHVDDGTQGASSANKFDLYDPAILEKDYQVTFKKSASGKYLMLWANDNGTMTGKVKDNNTDTTWADIV